MKLNIEEIKIEINSIANELGDVQLMEVCGTHTVSLFRSGVKSLLPENIKMLSGPGCPVCVTSQGYIDVALELADRNDVIVCTYGDMIRVPGGKTSLEEKRATGSDIRVLYSSREALNVAEENLDKEVIWLGVGFETTAPTSASVIKEAHERKISNFSVLNAHKLAIPAMQALLAAGDVPIDGFLCPGHVSVIIGEKAYQPIIENYKKPCVIAGFEAPGMLRGILHLLRQVKEKRAAVENVYGVAVTPEGNQHALDILKEVYKTSDSLWRAIGSLPASGLELKPEYKDFDAKEKLKLEFGPDYEPAGCKCGEVIQGKLLPMDCALFGNKCTPQQPVGPCMVSSEGTCAAWYKYGRDMESSRKRI